MSYDFKSITYYTKSLIRRPKTVQAFSQFLKSQHISTDELLDLNWRKRKRLLTHAFNTVPFYRKRYADLGIHPSEINQPEDFEKLPLLTKQDLRKYEREFISSTASEKHLRLSTTGGSTGVPIKVFHDVRFPQEALGWRQLHWWDVRPGMDEAIVWRSIDDFNNNSWYKRHIQGWPTKRIWFDASNIATDKIVHFIKEFNRVKPRVLWGYAGAIDYIASFIEKKGFDVPSPDVILMTSSPISLIQRSRVEKIFGAPVCDQYGSGEVYFLAAQCREKDGLHMFHDSRHIEFIDEKGLSCPVGTLGRIVVTDLDNYAFPIIRYLNDDMGKAKSGLCNCGINLPLMNPVKGRISELIKMPDGMCISGDYLTTIFDDFPTAVNGFKVYQKADYSINLLVVPNAKCKNPNEICQRVQDEFHVKTKNQVPIRIIYTEEIPADRGKTRFVVSEIKT